MGVPLFIIHFNRIFHDIPSILRYPHLQKHPYDANWKAIRSGLRSGLGARGPALRQAGRAAVHGTGSSDPGVERRLPGRGWTSRRDATEAWNDGECRIIPTAASFRLVKYDHLPRMVIYLMIYGHEMNYESLINQQYMSFIHTFVSQVFHLTLRWNYI